MKYSIMVHFHLSIILLLTCCCRQMQVQAFFDITTEALNLNHKLMKEVEIMTTYKNTDELEDKLKNITGMWYKFMDKFVKEQNEDLFVDDISTEAYNASYTLHYYLQNFQKTRGHVIFTLLNLYNDKKYFEKYRFWHSQHLSTLSRFIYENDYNLYTDKTWKDNLNYIHESLLEIDTETGHSVVSLITNNTQTQICKRQSRQQLLFNILRKIVLADAGGFVAMTHAYAIYKIYFDGYDIMDDRERNSLKNNTALWKNKNIVSKMREAEREFVKRNTNTLHVFKTYIAFLPRNVVWNCDSIKDDSYVKMERVFQKYIANEVDLNEEGTCQKECTTYTETKIYGCYDQNICARQRICNGTIRNCDNRITSVMDICLSNKDDNSRYDYVDVKGTRYGRSGSCKNDQVQVKSWPRGFYQCIYCMCICENPLDDGDRFFNLRPVTSDMDLNYVVTGARFRRENGIIHIQIQQGQLLQNGVVNSTTLEWKLVDNYTINDGNVKAGKDYHIITWIERTLFLDELDSPKNHISDHVITGLRFKLTKGSLRLEIRITNFNFTTGKLVPENSRWYSNRAPLKDRTELQLDDLKENVSFELKSNQYLNFTTSALEIDAGQNTIPFIDITSVKSRPAVPLSGAGIFVKSDNTIGIFLSLKLLTYDFEQYIKYIEN